MDDFDLYLDANLTMYSYWSTKTSLCMVKDQPKGGGRSYNIIYIYIIYYMTYYMTYLYIYYSSQNERNFFFLKRLHWERKLHFRDCILHVPPYLIALKSFWSTAKCCDTNEFLSTKSRSTTKILGKKSCELEFRFNAALPPILRCGEFSWPIHTVAFQDLILWKLNLSISWFNGEER
jgi:hypothetical protein